MLKLRYILIGIVSIFILSGCRGGAIVNAIETNNIEKFKIEYAKSDSSTKGYARKIACQRANKEVLDLILTQPNIEPTWCMKSALTSKLINTNQKLDMVDYLLAKKADIRKARSGDTKVIKYIESKGADPKYSLIEVVKANNLEGLLYLLDEKNVSPDFTTHSQNEGPLHEATHLKHASIVKALVERGANTRSIAYKKYTPYDYANNSYVKSIMNNQSNLMRAFKQRKKVLDQQKAQEQAVLEEQKKKDKITNDKLAVNQFIKNNDFKGLKAFTQNNPNSVYYIQDKTIRLLLTGPNGMKVGDIKKLKENGRSSKIIVSLIKRVQSPYKEYTLDEIDTLLELGLNDNEISAMIDVTTKLLDNQKKKQQQEQLIKEQERIAKQNNKTKIIYKNSNTQNGNSVGNQLQNEIIKQGVNKLFDKLF